MSAHSSLITPEAEEKLSAMDKAKAVFVEYRDKYLSITGKARAQMAEAERLDAEAERLGQAINDGIRSETLTPEEIRAMGLEQNTASGLAARYRAYAAELDPEAERLKLYCEELAARYLSAWGEAARAYADGEFEAEFSGFRDALVSALRRREALYRRVPAARVGHPGGTIHRPGLSQLAGYALDDLVNALAGILAKEETGIGEAWPDNSILSATPDIQPFRMQDVKIGLGAVARHRKLADYGFVV
jgi:hypothetical protein